MLRCKSPKITWLVIFAFLFSSVASTGLFAPGSAIAYHVNPDDGHGGPNAKGAKKCTGANGKCPPKKSPVHITQGNYVYSHQDLFIPGRGFSLEVTRTYDSQDLYNGPFGHGWKFNFDIKLTETTDESQEQVTIRRSDGVRLKFSRNPDGIYTSPQGRKDALTKNADGTFVWCSAGCATCGGTCYYFSAAGYLTRMEDPYDNQMIFNYDGTGKLIKVTDASGRVLNITYGSNNKIATITGPASRGFSYAYDSKGNLTGYTDPLGNTAAFTYDTKHHLTSITDARGNTVTTMTYDDSDRVTTYSEYGETWTYTYDPQNNRTYKDDSAANRWTYTYNDTGQLLSESDPLGYTVTYTWDVNLNWTSTRDAMGYTTTYTYDADGNRLTETDPLGNTTTYTYDPVHDKVATITDPAGTVTKYEYDENGNVIKITQDFGGSLASEANYTYDTYGHLASVTDPLGSTTSIIYDTYGNLTRVTDALGDTSSFIYDIIGNMLTQTDCLGNSTSLSYDLLGRPISIANAMGNSTTFTFDANGNLINLTDPADHTTTFVYDLYNQVHQLTDALGNTAQCSYDSKGNLTGIIDANGNTTVFNHDVIDQLTGETNALGNTTQYAYEGNGNLVSITDANGHTTTFTYDALNRVTRITYPGGGFESFSYDTMGNFASSTDRNGGTTNYTYDALQRQTLITYPGAKTANLSYDLNGNMLGASNADVNYTFIYDVMNRMTGMTNVTLGKAVSYTYDCSGQKNSMTDPQGGITNYTYDALRKLTGFTNTLGETTIYTYDNLSMPIRKDLANGTYTTFTYDDANRLSSLVHKTSVGSVISNYAYAHDKAYNITSMTTPAGSQNYSYDKIYQLLQATHPSSITEKYTYDPVYNRLTSSNHDDWIYDTNNRLLSYGNMTYTYDANGNMTSHTDTDSSAVTNYQYDYENKLTRIDYPDGTYSEYAYDPFGNRIKKNVNGTVTWFVYDFSKALPDMIAEYDGAGNLLVNYTHGNEIDEIVSMRKGGKSFFYLTDLLGSITSIIDDGELPVKTYEYDSFGSVVGQTGSVSSAYGYAGRILDSQSGLMYYRARYYSPDIGRFITGDPIGMAGGLNLYCYTKNNPINYVDPTGEAVVSVIVGAIALIGALIVAAAEAGAVTKAGGILVIVVGANIIDKLYGLISKATAKECATKEEVEELKKELAALRRAAKKAGIKIPAETSKSLNNVNRGGRAPGPQPLTSQPSTSWGKKTNPKSSAELRKLFLLYEKLRKAREARDRDE